MPLVGENSRGWPVPQRTDLYQSVNEGYALVRHMAAAVMWVTMPD